VKNAIVAILMSICSLQICYSQSGWNIISDPLPSPNSIWSMYFLNELTGYIAAHDNTETYSIMKTTNGGYNWVTQVSGTNAKCPYAIYFINEFTGFATTGDPWGFTSAAVYKTTNGGNNWSMTNLPDTSIYRAVKFIDINTGYIAGAYGRLRKTTNGGLNWILLQSNTGSHLRSIFFTDVQTGYICGSSGTILKTSNSGANWTPQTTNVTEGFYSIYFVNSMTGFAVGDENQISITVKTTNGGNIWVPLNIGMNFRYLQSVYFMDANTGYIGGSWGSLLSGSLKTTNGGLNWFGQDIPGGSITKNIYFFNNLNGIASEFHYVIKTTNSGTGVPNSPTLQGSNIGSYKYRLSWNDNTLAEDGFRIEMKTNIDTNWVIRHVTQANVFSVTDSGFAIGPIYYFRNYAFNNYGNSNYSNVVSFSLVPISPIFSELPQSFELLQNYPNPFNPNSKFKFQMPKSEFVKLKVYDALGKEIQTLVNEQLSPGTYEVDFDGSNLPSGVYYYKLEAGSFTKTRKMVLIK
jgi:photosystem II stability/assembly factor-like uncharacterized protein